MASGMREAVLGGCILHTVSTSLRVLQPDSPQCTRRNQERPRARSLFREGTFWRRHGVGVRSWSTEEGREHSVSLQFCIRTMGSFGWWSGESRLKYKVLSCRGSAAPSLLHLRSGSGTRSLSNGRREISGCGSQGLLKGPRRDWHCLILWKLLASPSLP